MNLYRFNFCRKKAKHIYLYGPCPRECWPKVPRQLTENGQDQAISASGIVHSDEKRRRGMGSLGNHDGLKCVGLSDQCFCQICFGLGFVPYSVGCPQNSTVEKFKLPGI